MNDIGQQFRMMLVTGTSPDGNVRATITGERILRIDFQRDSFEWYDEQRLERQLAGLATNTWVAWERERREISRTASGLTHAEADEARQTHKDQELSSYGEKLRSIECTGISSGQTVAIRTIGMTHWQVSVADGTLRMLDVRRFAGELRSAFESLLRDRESKIILLRAEYFDLGIPRHWRDRAAGA
ncbi:hypothetical protein [Actinoplanes sp. OR16]|uniref:hypothetical protein n=1 Tax=Actinoplanes sp. OR16 TaxID=946334 RepID=UPI000FDAC517|nr:hypothetical protein [Actinoplanes sp. OR16]